MDTRFFTIDEPLELRRGGTLPSATIAYETHGTLNEDRSNAVVVFHALTGSHHVAGTLESVPGTGTRWTDECIPGWWDPFVGPGKAIDTDRFFVVCANYLGSCYGSTGPASPDPSTGRPYGSRFPSVTFADIADTQVALLRSLGIEKLHAAVGGSTGGFLALSLATRYPEFVDRVAPLASGVKATALQTITNFEQITAIQNDPAFQGGDYYPGPGPERGLMLARMIGHKTFVSLAAMEERARTEVIKREGPGTYLISNTLESYMWHQAEKFVRRFDANSYLRIMEAWQQFDLAADAGVDDVSEVFVPCKHQEYLVFSIDSDVCFYPEEQADLAWNLKRAHVPYRRITVHSEKGHDAFLVDPDLFAPHLRDFLG